MPAIEYVLLLRDRSVPLLSVPGAPDDSGIQARLIFDRQAAADLLREHGASDAALPTDPALYYGSADQSRRELLMAHGVSDPHPL